MHRYEPPNTTLRQAGQSPLCINQDPTALGAAMRTAELRKHALPTRSRKAVPFGQVGAEMQRDPHSDSCIPKFPCSSYFDVSLFAFSTYVPLWRSYSAIDSFSHVRLLRATTFTSSAPPASLTAGRPGGPWLNCQRKPKAP